MRQSKLLILRSFTMLLTSLLSISRSVDSQDIMPDQTQFLATPPTEAPTGFDLQTNGLTDQATIDADRAVFEESETIADGPGPVYNARSCAECHTNPVTGGHSQVTELRVGHFDGRQFIDHPGGSLIQERAIDAAIQERMLDGYEVRAFRITPSILGAGFIEAIDSDTLLDIARNQPLLSDGRIHGQLINVPVLEAISEHALRAGRFGWKNQHASLVSFAADAYLNEMGILVRCNRLKTHHSVTVWKHLMM